MTSTLAGAESALVRYSAMAAAEGPGPTNQASDPGSTQRTDARPRWLPASARAVCAASSPAAIDPAPATASGPVPAFMSCCHRTPGCPSSVGGLSALSALSAAPFLDPSPAL